MEQETILPQHVKSLYQLLRQFESKNDSKKFYLSCSNNLGFPAHDIASICYQKNIKVELNVMGLFGSDGCLPNYFNDLYNGDNVEQAQRLKDFFNIFHDHLYRLSYLSWKQYQMDIGAESGDMFGQRVLKTLFPRLNPSQDSLALSQFFSGREQSLVRLRNLLELLIPNTNIEISVKSAYQSISRSTCLLGHKGNYLGDNVFVGGRFLLGGKRLSITIGSISADRYFQISKQKNYIASVLQRFLSLKINYVVKAIVKFEINNATIGSKQSVVGHNVFIGCSQGSTIFTLMQSPLS